MQELHCLDWGHIGKVLAEYPGALHNALAKEQILAACARSDNVDSRVDTLIRELAVELKLHITRTFELLENNLVHLRAGVDKCCRNDG